MHKLNGDLKISLYTQFYRYNKEINAWLERERKQWGVYINEWRRRQYFLLFILTTSVQKTELIAFRGRETDKSKIVIDNNTI